MSHPVDAARFADAVDALGLENFSGAEAVTTHANRARGVANSLPPAWGAARLLVVLLYAQELRDRYRAPLWLNSLYRSPAYNAAIRGASRSQHKACAAVDLGCADPRRLATIARRMQGTRVPFTDREWRVIDGFMRAHGVNPRTLFSSGAAGAPFDPRGLALDREGFTVLGGVGLYPSFVHVDLRGSTAVWG